ncbi:hypothetical protein KHS38_04430 [Mucilaginibacter sp. Bleaf8]|uniref:hypothetical protein n=1 Tax=Mucilaginibacter sp. Bleaf8 TaxID=2834430 RepID=UPI001BCCAA50|nr:hypothetical protein [Mucilaginibacter sp. Bleaf8]MBS7563643.1 hypothetical protein [Mucilaginibacter sp. Bleaf8]
MKLITIVIVLVFFTARVCAQSISGMVIDRNTKLPVAGARIATGYQTVGTNGAGYFHLTTAHAGDTVYITGKGYKPYQSVLHFRSPGDTIKFYLDRASIILQPVTVTGKHNATLDSLKTRREFSSVLAQKASILKEGFITRNPYQYTPYDNLTAPNNTTTMVSFNALSLLNLFSKKKSETSRLQKTILKDEESNYLDRTFSKQLVNRATGLQGDSLQQFMTLYRPTTQKLKSMTQYDLIMYVKDCYKSFTKTTTRQL